MWFAPVVFPQGSEEYSQVMKTASKVLNISGLGGDRSDWWIAAFCMVLGSAGLRAVGDPVLWNELLRRSGPQTTQPMGEVLRKGGGVRFRSQGSPLWHDVAERSESVSAGDTIFTGEDGHAELKLLRSCQGRSLW